MPPRWLANLHLNPQSREPSISLLSLISSDNAEKIAAMQAKMAVHERASYDSRKLGASGAQSDIHSQPIEWTDDKQNTPLPFLLPHYNDGAGLQTTYN